MLGQEVRVDVSQRGGCGSQAVLEPAGGGTEAGSQQRDDGGECYDLGGGDGTGGSLGGFAAGTQLREPPDAAGIRDGDVLARDVLFGIDGAGDSNDVRADGALRDVRRQVAGSFGSTESDRIGDVAIAIGAAAAAPSSAISGSPA